MGSTFVPNKIRPFIFLAEGLPNDLQLQLLKIASDTNHKERTSEISKLSNSSKIPQHNLLDVYGAFLILAKLHRSLQLKDFKQTLQELGLSQKFLENILVGFHQSSPISYELQTNYSENISEIKWKVDLSLSGSKFKTAPVVIHISIELLDKRRIVFSMDQKKLHIMRYNIILLIKQILSVKKFPILKK